MTSNCHQTAIKLKTGGQNFYSINFIHQKRQEIRKQCKIGEKQFRQKNLDNKIFITAKGTDKKSEKKSPTNNYLIDPSKAKTHR